MLSDEPSYKVKKIMVSPGKRLSLQRHQHRSEHWFILTGQAKITVNDRVTMLSGGQSIDIPQRALHRVENTGQDDLLIIEVQTGEYFGEDDIERLEDDFCRCTTHIP